MTGGMTSTPLTSVASAPPGVIPSLENPQDVYKTFNLVVEIVCIAFTTPCVLLRVYIRCRMVKSFVLEDWLCLTAWIFATFFFISGIIMGEKGGGYHDWELSKDSLNEFKRWTYIDIIVHSPTTFLTKATLLLIFARVFSPYRPTVVIIHVFLYTMLAAYVVITILKIRICTPIAGFWNPRVRISCLVTPHLFLADTVLSVVTDIIILVLPIPLLWTIRMTRRKKFGITALLGAGGLATSMSLLRLVYSTVPELDIPDAALGAMRFKMLASAELAIGLICACFPSFNVLCTRFAATHTTKRSNYTADIKMSRLKRSLRGDSMLKNQSMPSYIEVESVEHIALPVESHTIEQGMLAVDAEEGLWRRGSVIEKRGGTG